MNRHPLVDQLRTRRRELGLSHNGLAIRLSKSRSTVGYFENGPGGRQLLLVEEVAAALGMRLALVPIEEPAELGEAS